MPDLVRISCPECHGVLEAQVQGPKHVLVFVCRVQHTFSVVDLLGGKEDDLEARLWATLNVAEELAEFVTGLGALAAEQGLGSAATALRTRATGARTLATQLRPVIEGNRAVEIGEEVTRIHAADGQRTAAPR